MSNFLNEVATERQYQIKKWGDSADLLVNTPMDFVGYIASHSTRWFGGGFRPYSRETVEDFRNQMIKVGALAMAAVEHADAILDGKIERKDVLDYGQDA